MQSVLPVVESAEDCDRDYEHLVAHLFPEEEQEGKSHRWTRIFGSKDAADKQVALHELGPDQRYDTAVREALSQVSDYTGEILFSPQNFKASDLPSTLEEGKLEERALMELAVTATEITKAFRDAETKLADTEVNGELKEEKGGEKSVAELKRGYTRKRDDLWLNDSPQPLEMPDAVTVKKKRRRNQLSVEEQRDIVATVKELKLSHAQAAIRFGVTTLLVSKLVTESRK